jgi:hypothetical protein
VIRIKIGQFCNVGEAAQLFGATEEKVLRLLAAGKFPILPNVVVHAKPVPLWLRTTLEKAAADYWARHPRLHALSWVYPQLWHDPEQALKEQRVYGTVAVVFLAEPGLYGLAVRAGGNPALTLRRLKHCGVSVNWQLNEIVTGDPDEPVRIVSPKWLPPESVVNAPPL